MENHYFLSQLSLNSSIANTTHKTVTYVKEFGLLAIDNNNRTSYTTNTTGQYRCNVTNEVGSVVSLVITILLW